jgi:hypothetical protein
MRQGSTRFANRFQGRPAIDGDRDQHNPAVISGSLPRDQTSPGRLPRMRDFALPDVRDEIVRRAGDGPHRAAVASGLPAAVRGGSAASALDRPIFRARSLRKGATRSGSPSTFWRPTPGAGRGHRRPCSGVAGEDRGSSAGRSGADIVFWHDSSSSSACSVGVPKSSNRVADNRACFPNLLQTRVTSVFRGHF